MQAEAGNRWSRTTSCWKQLHIACGLLTARQRRVYRNLLLLGRVVGGRLMLLPCTRLVVRGGAVTFTAVGEQLMLPSQQITTWTHGLASAALPCSALSACMRLSGTQRGRVGPATCICSVLQPPRC